MGAIFSKRIKAHFHSILSIIAIAAIAMGAGIMFTRNNISVAYPNLDSMISTTSLIAALAIPLISCFSLSNERKRSDGYLRSLPINEKQTVIGTFLADLAFVLIPTLIMAIYPVILASYGKTSYGYAYAMLFVFVVFEIFFVALSTMFSSLFRQWWAALIATYSTIVVLFLIGAFSALLPTPLAAVCEFISPFRRFDPIVYGKLDLSSLLFYLLFALLFVFVAVKYFCREKKSDGKFKKFRLSVSCIVAAVAVVALSVLSVFLPSGVRWADVSANRIYATDQTSRDFLSGLEEDVTVYFIDTDGSEEKLISFVERYCSLSPRVKLEMIDTSKDTSFKAKYDIEQSANLKFCMIVESEKRYTTIGSDTIFRWYNASYPDFGYMSGSDLQGNLSSLGAMLEEYYPMYQSMSTSDKQTYNEYMAMYESLYMYSMRYLDIETVLNHAIDYVTTDLIPTFYFVTGHGEKNTSAGPFDITKADSIPPEASMLFINTPESDYSDAEYKMLADYMDNGGRLVIFTSESNNSMPNLMKLLAKGGLSPDPEPVDDGDDNICTATVHTTADALAMLNTGEKVTLDMTGASSILADSSDSSLKHTALYTLDTEVRTEVEDGEGGTTTDVKVRTQNLGMSVTKNGEPMLIWVTGSDTFNIGDRKLTEEEYKNYSTAMYGISSMIYWTGKTFTSSIRSLTPVAYDVSELLVTKEGSAAFIGTVVIGVFPLAIAAVGAALIYVRRKRSSAQAEK